MGKIIAESACRVCLSEQEIMINIFDVVEDFQSKLSDLLEYCGDLKVENADGYPKLICEGCTSELLIAAKFREKCKRTQEILSQFITSSDMLESALDVESKNIDVDESIEFKEEIEDDEAEIILEKCEDVEYSQQEEEVELVTTDLYEEVEFLEGNDNRSSYVIFDESSTENQDNEPNMEKDESYDQDLYERIVKAAKSAAVKKYATRMPVAATKPLVINCKCEVCGAGFTHYSNLRKHLQTHNPEQIYTCTYCEFPFTNIEKLEKHLSNHKQNGEENDKPQNMDLNIEDINILIDNPPSNAKKKSINLQKDSGKRIMSSFENDIETREIKKNHSCQHCSKRFVSKSALSAHLRIHTGDKPFSCNECTKSFTTQGGLVLHMRRHSGLRPFSCDICDKRFVESSNLKVHMRIHTGEKPHKCTICNRSFARVFLLQIHQRTHTGERPYHCPFCDKAFAQQGDLAAHKRIHTGERPHTCPLCKKGFIKSSGLTQHMRKHRIIKRRTPNENKTIDESQNIKTEVIKQIDIHIVEDEDENNGSNEVEIEEDITYDNDKNADDLIEYPDK